MLTKDVDVSVNRKVMVIKRVIDIRLEDTNFEWLEDTNFEDSRGLNGLVRLRKGRHCRHCAGV